ncbi:MAG: hypothetical protein O3A40_08525 [Bacteroidetes bacterium]|nr:hypothetical protein [Bacteroidota bacterium]
MKKDALRAIYHRTERFTVVILLFALPAFGIVYLYQQSGSLSQTLPSWAQYLLLGGGVLLLGVQYLLFHQKIKQSFQQVSLLDKVGLYSSATRQRFMFLFLVSVLSTVGLFLTGSPGFVLLFTLTLVFFSLGKPSPDRMVRLMKLKKEDRELLTEISRPA